MSDIINAEIVSEVVELKVDDIILIEQQPIVEYSQFEQFNLQILSKIDSLGIDTIKSTEENLQLIKDTERDLNNDLKEFEEVRKNIKKQVEEPYKKMNKKYQELIYTPLGQAVNLLKEKRLKVEDDLRAEKTIKHKKYFEKLVKDNNIDFLSFDKMNLNVQLSYTDNKLKKEVDEYIEKVLNDLNVMNAMEDHERILASYMKDLDLSRAILEVKESIAREKEIIERKEREKAEELKKQEVEREIYVAPEIKEVEKVKKEEPELPYGTSFEPPTEAKVEDEVITVVYTVKGTREEISKLEFNLWQAQLEYLKEQR